MADNISTDFTGLNAVPSGQLINNTMFESELGAQGNRATRQGIYNLYFPDKGYANFVPWPQIRRIEVGETEAKFILYSGLEGFSYHQQEKEEYYGQNASSNWYKVLEGNLITWSLQSEPWFVMPNGAVAYTFGVPRVVWLRGTPFANSKQQKEKLYNQEGVSAEQSGAIIAFHEDVWEMVAKLKAEKEKKLEEANPA